MCTFEAGASRNQVLLTFPHPSPDSDEEAGRRHAFDDGTQLQP